MRTWIWIGVVSPLVACGPGTLEIGDGLGSVGSDSEASGDTTPSGATEQEESSTTDPEPEPEPEPFEWAGNYGGMVEVFLWGNGWNICRAGDSVTLELDEQGGLWGEGVCKDGFGSYPLIFDGSANEDGRISGEVLVEVPWERDAIEESFEFGGWVGDDGLWIEWDSAIEFDGWDMPVAGEVQAE